MTGRGALRKRGVKGDGDEDAMMHVRLGMSEGYIGMRMPAGKSGVEDKPEERFFVRPSFYVVQENPYSLVGTQGPILTQFTC